LFFLAGYLYFVCTFMHPVVYFAISCALLGAAGLAIAGRGADRNQLHQRWIDYWIWVVLTTIVGATVFVHLFPLLTILIILAGLYEVIRAVVVSRHKTFPLLITVVAGYTLLAAGFLFFSFIFKPWFVFSVFLQVMLYDVASKITSHLAGRRRRSSISPYKRMEGVIGGVVCCILTALITSLLSGLPVLVSLFIGVLTATAAFSGDLLANWFRRTMATRDHSRLLPAAGGLLDRFDGFMFSGWVYYWLSITMLKDVLSPSLVLS